jgi:hypothetical protein
MINRSLFNKSSVEISDLSAETFFLNIQIYSFICTGVFDQATYSEQLDARLLLPDDVIA